MAQPRFADRHDVEEQLAQWDNDVLQCRTYGHPWQPARATLNRKGFWTVVERCPRCTSSRHYEMSTRGIVFGKPHIDYAEGYLSVGLGRIVGDAKGAVRLAATVQRTTAEVKKLTAKQSLAEAPHSRATREALAEVEHQQKEAS